MESDDILTKIVLPLLIFAPSLPSIISLLTFGYKLGHGNKVKVVEKETVRRIEEIDEKYNRKNVVNFQRKFH